MYFKYRLKSYKKLKLKYYDKKMSNATVIPRKLKIKNRILINIVIIWKK